jgi:hypothetical protein
MTVDILRTDGRGRCRPSPPWRRYDVGRLRLDRLAADLEAEADRWPDDGPVHVAVVSSASALRTAAESLADPD